MKTLDFNRAGMTGRAGGAEIRPAGLGGFSVTGGCVFQTNRLHSPSHPLSMRVKRNCRQM